VTTDLVVAEDALAEKRAILHHRLAEIHKRGPLFAVQVLLAAESFGDLISRYKYLYLISRQDRQLVFDVEAGPRARIDRIAIVGLGGTGSYVLDFVAKTPVQEIHLFDGDEFLTHNAFRTPGAASLEVLRAKPKKVDYLAAIYSNMHRRVVPHSNLINADNVESLRQMSFVFISIDDGPSRKLISGALDAWGIPYVDTGMGLYASDGSLGGIVRVTASMPGRTGGLGARASFADGSEQNEYRQNIQIAELNALNAAFAVVRWKKLRGFYADMAREHNCTYGVEVQALTRGDEIP